MPAEFEGGEKNGGSLVWSAGPKSTFATTAQFTLIFLNATNRDLKHGSWSGVLRPELL